MESDDLKLATLIKSQATYFAAPQALRDRMAAGLTLSEGHLRARRPARSRLDWWPMAAAFAVGVMLAVSGVLVADLLGQRDRLVTQVVDDHVRSLMVAHLSDVVSTDQHTVKPWFEGKLDYSPPVRDLAQEGYPLAGGRLDYLDGHPVAALVYRHRLHAINVFVWPVRGASPFVAAATARQGFSVISWQEGGMEFWAVADVQFADLQKFAELMRSRPPSGP